MPEQLKWLGPHLKGHLFLFEAPPRPTFDAAAGWRLLLVFLLLEGVVGPRFSLLGLLGLLGLLEMAAPPGWVRVPCLLALALILVRYVARLRPAQIGLRSSRHWTRIEKSYFLQTLVIANVVFGVLYASRLRTVLADSALWGPAALLVGTNLLWGFYQELAYRGILQTELARRWGNIWGVLVANLVFTFGPLHFYHFFTSSPTRTATVLGGTFLIGLFFGTLFARSGNLAMVGILHGLGNAYIEGLGSLAR